MTERTVTEQQVISALVNVFKPNLGVQHMQYFITTGLLKELFPELPKVGELILCGDKGPSKGVEDWQRFKKLHENGKIITEANGFTYTWDFYRRQTPAERGEG
jgi:hypothetical protein